MVIVYLLAFLWAIQNPSVSNHSAAPAACVVAAALPVVQHLLVGRRVEDRQSFHQSWRHQDRNDLALQPNPGKNNVFYSHLTIPDSHHYMVSPTISRHDGRSDTTVLETHKTLWSKCDHFKWPCFIGRHRLRGLVQLESVKQCKQFGCLSVSSSNTDQITCLSHQSQCLQ